MGINWNIVAGSMAQTLADRENEYREFATDYFTKRFETLAEEKRDWSNKTREQKREIDKKIDALRAEGLSDNQIANGLNTYGENFFAVVADDLSKYKASDNYTYLMSQDKTGAKFREKYSERFNELIQTESQQGLSLDPVVQGLLDKFPEMTETPEIAQSIFGFDYTKGVREDIKGLGKGTEVPDYDAPAGLTGVSSVLSGTIRDVPEQQTYTGTMLDKQIVKRLQVKYGDFKLNVDSTRFETEGEKDKKKLDKIKSANAEALKIQRKFNEERGKTPPGSMEGGMSDQQLLEKVIEDLGIGLGTVKSDDNIKNDADATIDVAGNISSFVDQNPQNPVSNLINELRSIDGVDDALLQQIISAIAAGKPIRSLISGLNLSSSTLNRLNNQINELDEDDKNVISGFSAAPSQSNAQPDAQQQQQQEEGLGPRGELGPEDIDKNKQIVQSRPSNIAEGELWDSIYGQYFNPDGTAVASLTTELYNRLVRRYTVALSEMRNVDQAEDVSA
jgi:hypothetical protein